jgi:beta-N-acetylhexosaminidase
MVRMCRAIAVLLLPALAAGAALAAGGGAPVAPAPAPVPARKLLGQRLMVGFRGTTAPGALLGAVRRGEVGGVILFGDNIVDEPQVSALTGSLQRAADQGGNPPLLIAVDQEGGQVRRFTNRPPFLSAPEMGVGNSAATAFREGSITGHYLRARGVNMDLAPVLDMPTSASSFIWQEGRAFSFDAQRVARLATAFALGLQSARVAATGKHFPGVGSAPVDTDNRRQELQPNAAQRAQALLPYESSIARGLDSVLLSTAGFPAYDSSGASAALSSQIIVGLLRHGLHFGGVTITDSLDSPTGHDEISAGLIAASAGVDILLYKDSAPGELPLLEAALRDGRISQQQATSSYERILALKERVAGQVAAPSGAASP